MDSRTLAVEVERQMEQSELLELLGLMNEALDAEIAAYGLELVRMGLECMSGHTKGNEC